MTSKLTITDQRLAEIHAECEERDPAIVEIGAMIEELQERRKADSEPVAEVLSNRPGNDTSTIDRALPVGTQLYRHAQPTPETEREPIAWLNDAYLARGVVDGEACSEDAGPGYIPVYREASPAQPVPVVPDEKPMPNPLNMYAVDAVAAIAEVRGWNAFRAATLQAGNSPVIPEWIPVSERMPEKNGTYQVWNGEHVGAVPFLFGSFQCLNPEQVTHWMPTAKPPREVK